MKITFEKIKENKSVQTYIEKADESLIALGYTEHSFAHVTRVSKIANEILKELGYSDRHIEVKIKLDKTICSVMDYFEIFLDRMILCRKAAEKLGVEFWLIINKERVI